jgi:phosphinothricin acetyltransferase
VRLAVPSDGARLAEIYRPAVLESRISFEERAPDGAEMSRRVAQVMERTPWLVAEDGGLLLGYAYAGRHRERPAYAWSVETSIYVDATLHRGGVGRRLYATLFELLTLQGIQSAYAGVIQPNPASANFHRAVGFTEVGTFRDVGFKSGAWCDTLWLQRALGNHPVPPPPVRLLPQLAADPAVAAILAAAQW